MILIAEIGSLDAKAETESALATNLKSVAEAIGRLGKPGRPNFLWPMRHLSGVQLFRQLPSGRFNCVQISVPAGKEAE